ncbi:MAG: hypothetical protein ACYDA4_03240 [Ignavibacteriaceae bacterium]
MVGKISIWFFVGSLLLIYGIIILSANIYQYFHPSFGKGIVLENLHAGIWWGALLLIIGLAYIILFRPGKVK